MEREVEYHDDKEGVLAKNITIPYRQEFADWYVTYTMVPIEYRDASILPKHLVVRASTPAVKYIRPRVNDKTCLLHTYTSPRDY